MMNEQIKKAAKECGLWKVLDEWAGEFGEWDAELDCKPFNDFAEELIRECARFADIYVSESFGVHYSVGNEMKKHFGVGDLEKHMTIAWYDPTNHHVSANKHDPMFTPLGQLWPLHKVTSPLTDELIRLLLGGNDEAQEWNRKLVRAVECHHGIGEKE